MLKALMKKQLLELNSFYFQSRKTGKRRTTVGTILFMALWGLLFVYMGFIFYMMADNLIEPIQSFGEGWFYFCLMGLLAVLLGTFGSVFTTYSGLYQAKDNDLLLSMPIPPWKILTSRIVGVAITGMMYEAIVLIPTIIVRFLHGPIDAGVIVGTLLMCVDVAVLVTTLTCVLGWLVALIATRLKGKSWLTALISLALIAAYLYVCGNSFDFIDSIITNFTRFTDTIKGWLYPFYMMGLAAEGSVPAMLGVTAVCAAALAAVWFVLSRTFMYIATRHQETGATRRTKVNFARVQAGSLGLALLQKEWRRFTSNATYMLNAGLSSVLLPVMAIFAVIRRDLITSTLLPILMMVPGAKDLVVLVLTAVLCLIAGMNSITAPSVSLEGRSLWIAQVLPIPAARALLAKVTLHLLITLPAALVSGAMLAWVFGLTLQQTLIMLVCLSAYVLLIAQGGLAVNLKLPNLNWTSEVVPVKQGLSVMITLFGGWVVICALGGLYYLTYSAVSAMLFLGLCIGGFVLADVVLALWLRGRGAQIYARL